MIKSNLIILLISIYFSSFCDSQERKTDNHKDIILLDDTETKSLFPLKNMIGDSRIVMLGEADHYSGNVTEAKIQVMKFLYQEMGFDIIAFESGFYDLKKAAADIEQGNSVKLALAKSIFPIWINTKEFLPFIEFVKKNKKDLLISGFDSQFSGEYVFESLEDDLKAFIKDDVSTGIIDSWISQVETMADHYEFVDDSIHFNLFCEQNTKIQKTLLSSKSQLSDKFDEIDFLVQLLENIKSMASDYYYNKTGIKAEEEWEAKDSNVRDKLMAENLIFLANKYPDKKIMCWGATAHFANKIWMLDQEELKKFVPMGSYLKRQIGDDKVYILAFTALKDMKQDQHPIEQEFITKNASYGILNLKASNENNYFASHCLGLNKSPINGDWKEVLDGLFFLDTITKSTPHLLSLKFNTNDTFQQDTSINEQTDKNDLNINRQNVFVYQLIQSKSNNLIIKTSKVEDVKTKQGIPFVNIGIRESLIGTSTDVNGNFTIKIPKQFYADTVTISCIGYQTERIAVKNLSNHKSIALTPAIENLNEVTIQAEHLTAELIMKRVIEHIEQNYIQSPYSQLRLYRQRIRNPSDRKFYLYEELRNVYDDNGYNSVPMFPISYDGYKESRQGRQAVIDTISGHVDDFINKSTSIRGFIGISDVIDVRHNNFLNKSNLSKYEFELQQSVSSKKGDQFIISFHAKNPKFRTTAKLVPVNYSGTITINTDDYAIVHINSTVIQDKEKKLLSSQYPVCESEKVWFEKEIISYKKNGKYYYLDKLYHSSNWELNNKGFIEIHGLEIKEGKQPRPEKDKYSNNKTEEVYNPDDWKFLESMTK